MKTNFVLALKIFVLFILMQTTVSVFRQTIYLNDLDV